jgi:hypothetical protein
VAQLEARFAFEPTAPLVYIPGGGFQGGFGVMGGNSQSYADGGSVSNFVTGGPWQTHVPFEQAFTISESVVTNPPPAVPASSSRAAGLLAVLLLAIGGAVAARAREARR